MDDLFSPDANDVIQSFSFEELGRAVAGIAGEGMNHGEEARSLKIEGLYSAREESKGLTIANSALEQFGLRNANILQCRVVAGAS